MADDSKPGTPPAGGPEESAPGAVPEVELLKVVVSRDGLQVTAQWGLHPQMKKDLKPEEWQELSDIMAKVTTLVGNRFAKVLSDVEPDKPGSA